MKAPAGILNTMRVANAGGALFLVVVAITSNACMAALGGMGLRAVMGGTRPGSGTDTPASYAPTLNLPESPRTIEARIQVDAFVSRLPASAAEAKRRNHDVTTSVDGDLPELVRQAIARDFRVNLVFSSVRTHQEHADLVLRGVIYQFAEQRTTPWYSKVPLVGFLTGARERIEGGVQLELTLSTPSGRFVRLYQGQSVFPDASPGQSQKGRPPQAPGVALNRAFSEALRQIRAQMLADQTLTTGQWRSSRRRPSSPSRSRVHLAVAIANPSGG
jgi:hypothetical protein